MSNRQPKPWTPERHEACKARDAAATKGPWEDVAIGAPVGRGMHAAPRVVVNLGENNWQDATAADQEFMAHARDDVPDMLAKIEEQAATIARLKTSLSALDALDAAERTLLTAGGWREVREGWIDPRRNIVWSQTTAVTIERGRATDALEVKP